VACCQGAKCNGDKQRLKVCLQVVIIANSVVYFALSFITVPLYSLGVQMGSDFRPHIFSPEIKSRLMDIANANKDKVRINSA